MKSSFIPESIETVIPQKLKTHTHPHIYTQLYTFKNNFYNDEDFERIVAKFAVLIANYPLFQKSSKV